MRAAAPMPLDVRLMNTLTSLLVALVLLAYLGSGVWWMLRHPMFTLRQISVEGEVTRNNALTLKANVVPHLSGNLFTIDIEKTREIFESVPWVRSAIVHRQFPNSLRVLLQEQHPLALWGEEGSSTLLNEQGQVFEANLGEVEADALPRLKGPLNQSQEVLQMYQTLRPVLQAVDMDIDELELSPRGSWRFVTAQRAVIELGQGTPRELLGALQTFLRTLAQVTSRYGLSPRAVVSADLRHKDGYAMRLHGVTTTDGELRKKP
jgi:cell division protein FtsQ